MDENIKNPNGYTLDNIYDKTNLRVIGWTDYDDKRFEEGDADDEALYVIAREVRDNKYLFGGDSHEDRSGCTPVLNNGRIIRFSWRGWGAVIALAYDVYTQDGHLDHMAGYMDMMIKPEYIKRPPDYVDLNKLLPTEDDGDIDLIMPPPLAYYDTHSLFACAETEETKKAKPFAYANFYDTIKENEGQYCSQRIVRIVHAATFEELFERLEEEHIFVVWGDRHVGSSFGFLDAATMPELLKTLHEAYPETPLGVVCFTFY